MRFGPLAPMFQFNGWRVKASKQVAGEVLPGEAQEKGESAQHLIDSFRCRGRRRGGG